MTHDPRPREREAHCASYAAFSLLCALCALGCEEVPLPGDGGLVPPDDGAAPPWPDASIACNSSADCDDANSCTRDTCSAGGCEHAPSIGTRCEWGVCDLSGNCGLDPNAPCTGTSYQGADLRASDLSSLDLRCANLRGANLEGVMLEGRDLWRAVLVGAQLRGAHLAGADLRGADLTRADLSYADLFGARTDGAVLTGTDLTGAR